MQKETTKSNNKQNEPHQTLRSDFVKRNFDKLEAEIFLYIVYKRKTMRTDVSFRIFFSICLFVCLVKRQFVYHEMQKRKTNIIFRRACVSDLSL